MGVREYFGPKEAFRGYPLIEVIILAIGYRLLVIPFVLSSVSVCCQGQRIVWQVLGASRASGWSFGLFSKKTKKTQKQDCMQTYILLTIEDSVRQLA